MSASTMKRGFRVTRLLTLAPISLLAMLGCASIIGLDEYTVASSGGSAGMTGGAGRAGNGGNGGRSENAGSPGSAGMSEGGSTSEAGSSGLAGDTSAAGTSAAGSSSAGAAGATSAPVVGCDGKTPLTPNEQLVRSCLLRAGCDPSFNPVRSISLCVTYDTQAALPGESCNLDSKTCADYEACEHVGVAHDDLCGGTKVTRCENNVAINCNNYSTGDRFFDCNGLGGTCGTYTYSNNKVYADCKLDVAPDSCTGLSDDSKFYCHSSAGQDDLRYYCYLEKPYGSACTFGKCVDSGPGEAGCYFDLPSCTAPATPTCSSSGVATVCSGLDASTTTGSLLKYNCAAAGLSCGITAGTEYCLAPGCKAADIDTKCTESCSDDGTQLTFCYGGAPYTVNCADYGFTQCVTGEDTNKNPVAACRF